MILSDKLDYIYILESTPNEISYEKYKDKTFFKIGKSSGLDKNNRPNELKNSLYNNYGNWKEIYRIYTTQNHRNAYSFEIETKTHTKFDKYKMKDNNSIRELYTSFLPLNEVTDFIHKEIINSPIVYFDYSTTLNLPPILDKITSSLNKKLNYIQEYFYSNLEYNAPLLYNFYIKLYTKLFFINSIGNFFDKKNNFNLSKYDYNIPETLI